MAEQVFTSVLDDFRKDTAWLEKNYEELKKKYPEEYVAVYQEGVVDHDPDLDRLLQRLEKKYPGKSNRVAVEYVTTKRIEMVLCA